MSPYNMEMGNEKMPNKQLPAGNRTVTVVSMAEEKSKAGNMMFVTRLKDNQTGVESNVYLVAEKGKRWLLKQLLTAVGIQQDNDGNFIWDIPDVVGKTAMAVVEQSPEKWINREGEEIESMKSRVVEFMEASWDENLPVGR